MTFERAAYVFGSPDATVVGMLPSRDRASLAWVARREAARWRARGNAIRLPAAVLRPGGAKTRLSRWLRGGVIVTRGPRRLDAVCDAAGVRGVVSVGTGGGVVVIGEAAVLRAGQAGTPADPVVERDALGALASRAVPVPSVLASGVVDGVSWCSETRLAGERPVAVDDGLATSVVEVLGRFPAGAAASGALSLDAATVCGAIPALAGGVGSLAARAADALASLPGVGRHGDLWAGNLLVDAHGALTGIIDWDAFSLEGAPGADLVQLVATELRLDDRLPTGAALLRRPQHSPRFASLAAPYWAARELEPPTDDQLDAIAIAWWLTEMANSVRRIPSFATDAAWVDVNVVQVLAGLRRR